jgi:hypothetical protein
MMQLAKSHRAQIATASPVCSIPSRRRHIGSPRSIQSHVSASDRVMLGDSDLNVSGELLLHQNLVPCSTEAQWFMFLHTEYT